MVVTIVKPNSHVAILYKGHGWGHSPNTCLFVFAIQPQTDHGPFSCSVSAYLCHDRFSLFKCSSFAEQNYSRRNCEWRQSSWNSAQRSRWRRGPRRGRGSCPCPRGTRQPSPSSRIFGAIGPNMNNIVIFVARIAVLSINIFRIYGCPFS